MKIKIKGSVHWYDQKSKEGMLKDLKGNLYYIHGSALPKGKTIQDGENVNFEIIQGITWVQVYKVF